MKKKVISVLLVSCLCLATLFGCGGSDGSTGGNDGSAGGTSSGSTAGTDGSADSLAAAADLSAPLDITIWQQADDYGLYSSYDENPVVLYLEDKFNLDMQFQHPAMGSETDSFSLMLGTGDYTDVIYMAYSQDNISSLYSQGVIQDLTPYESYMPNYMAFLNDPANEEMKMSAIKDGKLLGLLISNHGEELQWGGMVYRRDILETMTGGNVAFPSGNDEPTTIEDMEYMLSLMTMYFQAAGMADYAALIIPASGFFQTNSSLMAGFGIGSWTYVDNGVVKLGPAEQNFYNYLTTMHDWYEKGYVYQDFASRTNDVFYLPNTALTYGAAAGVWYGLASQLGENMSMPEYNLYFDVRALGAPLDTAHGVTGADAGTYFYMGRGSEATAYAITQTCSEEDLIRYLQVIDYLYSEEGGMIKSFGLTSEMVNTLGGGAKSVYEAYGLEGGSYEFNADGSITLSAGFPDNDRDHKDSLMGMRLPGLFYNDISDQLMADEATKEAHKIWTQYGKDMNYPAFLSLGAAEADEASTIYTKLTDYMNTMVPKFIIGTEPLTEESFAAYVQQLNDYGLQDYIALYQKLYDDYKAGK